MRYTYVQQHDMTDCAAACLAMVCLHYKKETTITVAIDDAAVLAILLPISIVDNILSKFSDIFCTSIAFLLPSAARFFIRIRLTAENAVSVAEK